MSGSAPSFDRLTSRSTLYEAFARVHDNHGCRGADGVTVEQFAANLEAELDHLQGALLRGSYRPFPLLRFQIPKATSGLRALCVPTVRDRVLQSAVYLITRETFEAEFEDTSHAYRLGRSVRTAIHQIHRLRDQGYRWVVDADIDGFFDNIPHQPLLARLRRLGFDPRLDRLFTQWMQAEVYDGRRIVRLTAASRRVRSSLPCSPTCSSTSWTKTSPCSGAPQSAMRTIVRHEGAERRP